MSTDHRVGVILIGGSPLLQSGIVAAISQDTRLQLVGRSHFGRDMVRLICDAPPSVLVLIAESPPVQVASALKHLTSNLHRPKVLVLSEDDRAETMLTTLRLGVDGYGLTRHLQPADVCTAVLGVAHWGAWACPVTVRRLISQASQSVVAAPAQLSALGLSDRESEVLQLFADGTKEDGIARELNLSRNTVKTYLRRIRVKLKAPSRADAIHIAKQLSMLSEVPA